MKQIISNLTFGLALATSPVWAHVEEGLYRGHTAAGVACEMTSTGTHFLNDTHHPLNERVELEVQGQKFTVQHPPVISIENSLAAFNHDRFEGIVATPVGGTALIVAMDHTEGHEGPSAYTLITHNWRQPAGEKLECTGLQLVR